MSRSEMGPAHEAAGSERAHGAASPGLGFDSPYSVARAPQRVNQILENHGIEAYVRRLRDHAPDGVQYVFTTQTFTRGQDLTDRVYEIAAIHQGQIHPMFQFRIRVDGIDDASVRFMRDEVTAFSGAALFANPPINAGRNVDVPPTLQRAVSGPSAAPMSVARPQDSSRRPLQRAQEMRTTLDEHLELRIRAGTLSPEWMDAQDRLVRALQRAEQAVIEETLGPAELGELRSLLSSSRLVQGASATRLDRYARDIEAFFD